MSPGSVSFLLCFTFAMTSNITFSTILILCLVVSWLHSNDTGGGGRYWALRGWPYSCSEKYPEVYPSRLHISLSSLCFVLFLLLLPESFGVLLSCANKGFCYLNLTRITKFNMKEKRNEVWLHLHLHRYSLLL